MFFKPSVLNKRAIHVTAMSLSAVLSACNSNPSTLNAVFSGQTADSLTNASVKVGSPGYIFTTVSVGQSATAAISLKNLAAQPVFLKAISLPTNANYSLVSTTCPTASNALAAGGQCVLNITFKPTVGGDLPMQLNVLFGGDGVTYPYQSISTISGTGAAQLVFGGLNAINLQTVSTTKVALSWTPLTSAIAYNVYSAVLGSTLTLNYSVSGGTTSNYTVTGLMPNTTYIFAVKSLNSVFQEDSNTIQQQVTTNPLGMFSAIPTLSVSEGATVSTSDLSLYCTDGNGHAPTSVAIVTQSDSNLQCTMLTSPFQVQCIPNHKAQNTNWSGTVTLSCLLNDYATPYTQTLAVSVAHKYGSVSPTVSTVAASATSVTDDGVTTSLITITLMDANSNVVPGKAVALLSNRTGSDTISASSGPSNASGQVTFTVKSTAAGTSTYTAVDTTDSNLTLTPASPASVTYTAGTLNTTISTVVVDSPTETDNGTSAAHVTVTLLDSTSNAISGKTVTLTSSRPGSDTVTVNSGTTNSVGAATFTVTSTVAGTSVYTAKDATDSNTVVGTTSVTYNTGVVSQSLSTVTSSATTLVADNVYNATITVTVKDATSNLVSGKTVTLASNQTDTITPASAVTNASGVATFTVSSLGVHTSTFTATDATDSIVFNYSSAQQPQIVFTTMVIRA